MTSPLKILAFDPSCTQAAAALLTADPKAPTAGLLTWFSHIRPKGDDLAARVIDLGNRAGAIIREHAPDVIVVELPANRPMGRNGFKSRSVLDLPNYGMAVGAVLMVSQWGGPEARRAMHMTAEGGGAMGGKIAADLIAKAYPFRLFAPSVCDWVGRDVPSTQGDEYKTRRVDFVEHLYGLPKGHLGARTAAGNVADAVLLARWGLWRAEAPQGVGR